MTAAATVSDRTWAATDGTRIAARLWQPEGDARGVVCLVHGLGEHSGRYGHVAAYLAAAGIATLAPDLRGHGLSGGRRGDAPSFDALLDDVDVLLDQARTHFAGLPLVLYGHSLGGSVVLNHVLRRRPLIAGAISASPLLRTTFVPPAWKLAAGRALYRLAPAFCMSNGLRARDLSRHAAVCDAYATDPLVHDRVSARLALDMLAAGQWALDNAADLDLPLLLIHGSGDGICSVEASRRFAAAAGERCAYVEFAGLYHETHNEPEQTEVLGTIAGWIADRAADYAGA